MGWTYNNDDNDINKNSNSREIINYDFYCTAHILEIY